MLNLTLWFLSKRVCKKCRTDETDSHGAGSAVAGTPAGQPAPEFCAVRLEPWARVTVPLQRLLLLLSGKMAAVRREGSFPASCRRFPRRAERAIHHPPNPPPTRRCNNSAQIS